MREPQCGRELRSSICGCPGPLGISSVSQWCRTCRPRVGDPMHKFYGCLQPGDQRDPRSRLPRLPLRLRGGVMVQRCAEGARWACQPIARSTGDPRSRLALIRMYRP